MNRAPLVLLFLVVLGVASVAPATAQGSEAAAAPVQTLVDAVPRVVEEAIFEADRDGTPDAAHRIVRQMQDYIVGFEDGSAWPDDSDAATLPMDAILRYATGLVDLTAHIPGRVAAVERNQAACFSWQANATGPEVVRWAFQARPAMLNLKGTAEGLERYRQTAPVKLDLAPFERAVASLDAWLTDEAEGTDRCLVETAARLGVSLSDDFLTLAVSPRETWPHGTITVLGGSLDPDRHAQVRIVSEGLGLDEVRTLSLRGTYFLRYTLPANATLGDHTITVASATNETQATIAVDKIPVRLSVSGPRGVPLGAAYTVRFSVASVVPGLVPDGTLTVAGDLNGSAAADTGLRIDAVAPAEPTRIAGTATYSGDALFRAGARTYTVHAYDPAAVGTGEGEALGFLLPVEEEAETPAGTQRQGGLAEFFGFRIPFIFDYDTPVWVAIILVAIVVFIVWEAVVYIRAWRLGLLGGGADGVTPAAGTAEVRFERASREEGVAAGRRAASFPGMFVSFHHWAMRLRLARSSETARELAARYAKGNPALVRSVRTFEEVRYGGVPEPRIRRPDVTRRLVSAWRGVVRRLRR